VEGVEVNISCQTEDLGNVTPTLRLNTLGLAAQTLAGVETLLHIAIVLDVLTTDLRQLQLQLQLQLQPQLPLSQSVRDLLVSLLVELRSLMKTLLVVDTSLPSRLE